MGKDIGMTDRHRHWPRPTAGRFDQTSIAFHWLSVVLVTEQITTALLVGRGIADPTMLLNVHRSMGTLTWIVVATRLVWRHYFAYLPPFPKSIPKLQQQIAKLNEYGLYGLLLLQPLTGLAMMLFRGRPFALFFWEVPTPLSREPAISSFFLIAHKVGAWGLLALIGLHAAAALLHAFVLHDGVLQRMLPWTARHLPDER
jgi:cytochrome b561